MTKIANFGFVSNLPSDAPLRQSKLWNRDVETVSPTQITAFIKRMEMKGKETEARQNVEVLLSTLRKHIAREEIGGALVECMRLPEKRLSIDDFSEMLKPMSNIRKSAVQFALSANMKPEDIILLRWPEAMKLDLDIETKYQLTLIPRHIKTDLVFWEYVDGRLSPLLSLGAHVESVTGGMSWDWLKSVYDQIVPINFDLDYWLVRRGFWKALLN